MKCINCNSEDLRKLGMRFTAGKNKNLGYICNDCGEEFLVPYSSDEEESPDEINDDLHYVRDQEYLNKITQSRKIVLTTAVNNTKINSKFHKSIQNYMKKNSAEFVVLPLRYRNPSAYNAMGDNLVWYDANIEPFLIENNFDITDNLRVLGGLKTQATVYNPLSGIDGLSKGYSVVLGHPQVALKTLPRLDEKYPAIAATTGAITEKNYSSTKVGFKAAFNHSLSAVVIEIDDHGEFFIRHLNFDGTGFYDLDYYYDSKGAR